MMDTQTQKWIDEMESGIWRCTDRERLLQLVHEQDEDIRQINGYINELVTERDNLQERIMSLGIALAASRSIVAKYERVVETAKILIKKARDAKNVTGDNGQPDWYEYSASDFDALMDAVDKLEESK